MMSDLQTQMKQAVATAAVEQIKDGDSVEFELEEDQKGMRAVNVRPL